MQTVTTTPAPNQPSGVSSEAALLLGLLAVTGISIGAILWIVLVSGPNIGTVAQAAIAAISAVAVAAIGAITVAMRKRRTRTSRS